MKKTSSWLWGGVLIALGVILGINALGLARINIFFPGWWTLFIIIPSLIGLFTSEHKSGAVAGLVIGVCFLLSSLDIVPFGILWKLLLPALLVIVGVSVMVRGSRDGAVADRIAKVRKEQDGDNTIVEAEVVLGHDQSQADDDATDKEDDSADHDSSHASSEHAHESSREENKEYWSTFGDQNINYSGKVFSGCKVDAVFGGADIDLRQAKSIKHESIVKVSSIFGGVIIYVPSDVRVEVASTSIFGGVSDKRKGRSEQSSRTIFIEATCVFGGVEIR